MEREYKWRHGYMAFQQALLHDPAGKKTLLGDGDILDVISMEMPGHVAGLLPNVFFDRWLNENIAVNEELLALLPQVKVESIFIVTNQEPRRAARIKALYGKKSWVDGFVISSEIGYAKPDPAFFTVGLQRIGRTADECLLVDDNARFVEGAAEAGVKGILFRGNPQLIKDLTALGLLSEAPSPA